MLDLNYTTAHSWWHRPCHNSPTRLPSPFLTLLWRSTLPPVCLWWPQSCLRTRDPNMLEVSTRAAHPHLEHMPICHVPLLGAIFLVFISNNRFFPSPTSHTGYWLFPFLFRPEGFKNHLASLSLYLASHPRFGLFSRHPVMAVSPVVTSRPFSHTEDTSLSLSQWLLEKFGSLYL